MSKPKTPAASVARGKSLPRTTIKSAPRKPTLAGKKVATTGAFRKAPVATTVRMAPALHGRLEVLQHALKRPMNKLIVEAIDYYVVHKTEEVEADLRGTLARIKAAREKDPQFKEAIATFVQAESAGAKNDPAEGRVVIEDRTKSARSMVRDAIKHSLD
jgi:predicted transcriptional regulator